MMSLQLIVDLLLARIVEIVSRITLRLGEVVFNEMPMAI